MSFYLNFKNYRNVQNKWVVPKVAEDVLFFGVTLLSNVEFISLLSKLVVPDSSEDDFLLLGELLSAVANFVILECSKKVTFISPVEYRDLIENLLLPTFNFYNKKTW